MVFRIEPIIVSLQNQNHAPITVYIDSRGGSASSVRTIMNLLTSQTQNSEETCRIITVALTRAESAAADLLSYGDFALAYPYTKILHHGTRINPYEPLTQESSVELSEYLRQSANQYASELMSKNRYRFFSQLIGAKWRGWSQIKVAHDQFYTIKDYIDFMQNTLSEDAKGLFEKAVTSWMRFEKIADIVVSKLDPTKTKRENEAYQIKTLVDIQLRENKEIVKWDFSSRGLNSVTNDFRTLNDYLDNTQGEPFNQTCWTNAYTFLSDDEKEAVDSLDKETGRRKAAELAKNRIKPFYSLFASLCYSLQVGENELSAEDAYWLGLIDEIISREDLRSDRNYFLDKQTEQQTEKKENHGSL